jgi:hypothetical protein
MYGSFSWLDDINEKIGAFKPASGGGTLRDRQVRIHVAGEESVLTFTEAHFMRLKALWENG